MGQQPPPRDHNHGPIVDDESMERALHFLAQSAVLIGKAREAMMNSHYYVKHVEALKFLAADGSGEARKAMARCSEEWPPPLYLGTSAARCHWSPCSGKARRGA